MLKLEDILKMANENKTQIDGKWVPSRPVKGSFLDRLRDAIAVLKGKADAFKWPEQ